MDNQKQNYRQNVAAIILDNLGRILVCQRSDFQDSWQVPQGGIDTIKDSSGAEVLENPEEAIKRELLEELGTDDLVLLGKLDKTIRYDFPKELQNRGHLGQEQHYFLFRLLDDKKINLAQSCGEFKSFEWVTKSDFSQRVQGFKQDAYTRAVEEFSQLFPHLFNL